MALENMRGRGWQDITFGLLDGWWRFADDYRPDPRHGSSIDLASGAVGLGI